MKRDYDFQQAARSPYARLLTRPVTLRLDRTTIGYFEKRAAKVGVPYRTLIKLYLCDCAAKNRRLAMTWKSPRS